MSQLLSLSVIVGILTSAIRLATPYLYAGIGEAFSQSSGVVNLGVDGVMLISAYAAVFVVLNTGNIWLGLLAAMFVGLLMGLLMSLISVTLKAEQGISGIGLYMFGLGLSSLLFKTTIGYRIRAVGLNPDASRFAGINVPFYQALSLTLAGGFAGIAGTIEVIGVQHRLLEGITSGYGFSGIVAALFGGLHPLGAIPAAILFGGLLVGGDKMQRAVQVPNSLIDVILGLVVLFVVGSALWSRRWAARRMMASAKASEVNP